MYRAVNMRRRRNGDLILSYLESAVRLNLPLPAFLRAAENSEQGKRRRQLQALRQELSNGLSVSAALADTTDLSDHAIATIDAHESLGQLPLALSRLVEDRRPSAALSSDPDRSFYGFYQLYLVFALIFMAIGYAIFIMPKFVEILKDFKAQPPPETRTLMNMFHFLDDQPWLGPLIVLLLLLAILLPATIWMQRTFVPSWPLPNFSRGADWFSWRLPLLRSIQFDRAMAQTCDLLAQSIRSGVALPAAIDQALKLPTNPGFKARLARWRDALLQGNSPAQAAKIAALPPLLVGFLLPADAGVYAGPTDANLFDFLARYYRDRFSRTLIMLRAASEPILVVFCGLLVLFFVLALFKPLVTILKVTLDLGPGGPF